MRLRSLEEVKSLGKHAQQQIAKHLAAEKLSANEQLTKQSGSDSDKKTHPPKQVNKKSTAPSPKTKQKPSRVMRTADGSTYCPYPSTDPFVAVIQRLSQKYGRFEEGGLLITELIIDGGEKDWRFDIALISPFQTINVNGKPMYLGNTCLIEADGFGFHRSKDAFKNDRSKQTHALKHGFALKRITNSDARHRINDVIDDIEAIFSQPRLYSHPYSISAKGKTQSILSWAK